MAHLIDGADVSVIIPTFNEAEIIGSALQRLQVLRQYRIELIIADGGSSDTTLANITTLVDRVIHAPKGRARQMNAGAAAASGKWLLFLHVDTHLPDDMDQWVAQLRDAMPGWGFFAVKLDGAHWLFRCIEFMMNLRSRMTSVATGDQCLFIERSVFEQVGYYPDIPLMEDVAISKKLRATGRALSWRSPITTSCRRWEKNGIWRTIFLMWRLRLAYFLGVSPQVLHRTYYD